MRSTWAEVDLSAIGHNLRQIRRRVGRKVKILACVKADAYGHGAVEVSRVLCREGADRLGVALVDEALQLRHAGIKIPIHLLGCILPDEIRQALELNLTVTAADLNFCRTLSKEALKLKKKARVHLKIDTGMGRIGVGMIDAKRLVQDVLMLKGIELEGVFTHLPAADNPGEANFTRRQIKGFTTLCEELNACGVSLPLRHAANSAAILNYPESYLDMVRPGLLLYGLYPTWPRIFDLRLKPAFSLKTRVIFLKYVPPGTSISYGRTFRTKRKSLIATLPLGYDDGYNRALSNKTKVLIKGKIVPQVGTICMDQMMVDVTDAGRVKIGDEVVVYGSQSGARVPVEEIANLLGTVPHEVVCTVSERVKRIFKGGKNA